MEPSSPLPPERAAAQFAAFGSEQRLAVLRTLVRAGTSGLSIGVLSERTGNTGSTLTHPLRLRAAADLVRQQKQGRSIICVGADHAEVQALSAYLLTECCTVAPHQTHPHGRRNAACTAPVILFAVLAGLIRGATA